MSKEYKNSEDWSWTKEKKIEFTGITVNKLNAEQESELIEHVNKIDIIGISLAEMSDDQKERLKILLNEIEYSQINAQSCHK